MKRCLPALGLALLSSACATSRTGQAEVRLEAGVPCYGVTAAEAREGRDLRLHALVLYDTTEQPPKGVWELESSSDGRELPLPAGRCVRHGEVPGGYRTTPVPALKADRVYDVYLNATPATGRRSTHRYKARFCLAAATGDPPRLLTLAPNASRCAAT